MTTTATASPYDLSDSTQTADTPPAAKRRPKVRPCDRDMDLSLTSMIDVIFQLLIYFILTVNFIIDEGALRTHLPGPISHPSPVEPGEEFILSLHALDHTGGPLAIHFNGRTAKSFSELRGMLHDLRRGGIIDPEIDIILIEADPHIRWNHVVNAFNQCIASGYTLVNMQQPN